MKLTREQKISRGMIWQVYHPLTPDNILFEGSKRACMNFIRKVYGMRAFKKGNIQLGQLIHEIETK